jgi:hypothetical protein
VSRPWWQKSPSVLREFYEKKAKTKWKIHINFHCLMKISPVDKGLRPVQSILVISLFLIFDNTGEGAPRGISNAQHVWQSHITPRGAPWCSIMELNGRGMRRGDISRRDLKLFSDTSGKLSSPMTSNEDTTRKQRNKLCQFKYRYHSFKIVPCSPRNLPSRWRSKCQWMLTCT